MKNHGNEEKQKDVIGDFVRNSEIIMTIAMIVGSYIGTYLFHTYLKSKVYIISIVLFVISGILALFMKEDKAKQTSSKDIWKDFRKNCYQHLKQGLEKFLKNNFNRS